jgi:hypothetical protein
MSIRKDVRFVPWRTETVTIPDIHVPVFPGNLWSKNYISQRIRDRWGDPLTFSETRNKFWLDTFSRSFCHWSFDLVFVNCGQWVSRQTWRLILRRKSFTHSEWFSIFWSEISAFVSTLSQHRRNLEPERWSIRFEHFLWYPWVCHSSKWIQEARPSIHLSPHQSQARLVKVHVLGFWKASHRRGEGILAFEIHNCIFAESQTNANPKCQSLTTQEISLW